MPPKTVVSVKSGPALGICRIGLSDGSLFSFNTAYLPPVYEAGGFFFVGRELAPEEEEEVRFAAACYRAERAALRLIARAEQTMAGLERKLEHREHPSPCARAAVSRLAELDLVNDQRYAQGWLKLRVGRGHWSPRQLQNALRGRGIDGDTARAALKAVLSFEVEWALLERYLAKQGRREKKFRSFGGEGRSSPGDFRNSFLKQTLKYEGFSSPVIQRFWEEESPV
jgi:regulatory protein